jgi:hypothetical protein
MKIKQNDLIKLDAVKRAWLEVNGMTAEQARGKALAIAKNDPRTKDAAMRARFDLAYASGMGRTVIECGMYEYLDDNHLNTVYRRLWGI